MSKAYKMRLYPTEVQAGELNGLMMQARRVWNLAVSERERVYRQKLNISTHKFGQNKRICHVRNLHPETLKRIPANTVGVITARLHSAYGGAYTRLRKGERPQFPQAKKRCFSIPFQYGKGVKYHPADGLRHGGLYVMNVTGLIRVREHRDLPSSPIKQVNIRSERNGQWFTSFVYDEDPSVPCVKHAPAAGIDLNLSACTRITVSDGFCNWALSPPNILEKYEEREKQLSRAVSRKFKPGVKQSKRYYNAKRQRAKLHAKIARCRSDWIHNTTTWIAETFETVFCDDLSPGFMLKNKHQARRAADASFSEIKRQLSYKCGNRVVFVNPAYTTQRCSKCGRIEPKTLDERVHMCPSCGLTLDRDINAARNVLQAGLAGMLTEPFVAKGGKKRAA